MKAGDGKISEYGRIRGFELLLTVRFLATIAYFCTLNLSTSSAETNILSSGVVDRSVVLSGNQTSNTITLDQSIKSSQIGTIGQNQGFINVTPSAVINNYYGTVPSSVTKEAFDALERKLIDATNSIELTKNDIRLLAQALRDLDQRTADIQKLADGRTIFGDIVAGTPKVVIEAMQSGIQSYKKHDYTAALQNFRKAIEAFEVSKNVGGLVSETFSAEAIESMYYIASETAQLLRLQEETHRFAAKAFATKPDSTSGALLVTAKYNLGLDFSLKGKNNEAFDYFSKAVALYESITNVDENWSGTFTSNRVGMLYGAAAESGLLVQSNEFALKLAEKAQKVDPSPHHEIISRIALGVSRKELFVIPVNQLAATNFSIHAESGGQADQPKTESKK